ncbi:hypothetical protein CEXT_142261 [Caerostris extrusa]|uniref:Uncharacterized protein n=1 Tax=Caerostris extrusa TaxID=172846 RepID=A0AAV4T2P3_CAEEX|nr:hypothetical protein CEXT_142261 [Caerostris extrusa]
MRDGKRREIFRGITRILMRPISSLSWHLEGAHLRRRVPAATVQKAGVLLEANRFFPSSGSVHPGWNLDLDQLRPGMTSAMKRSELVLLISGGGWESVHDGDIEIENRKKKRRIAAAPGDEFCWKAILHDQELTHHSSKVRPKLCLITKSTICVCLYDDYVI